MSDGPLTRYRALVDQGRLQPDTAQRSAMQKLQLLSARLARGAIGRRGGWLGSFRFGGRGETEAHGGGIYLYGGVGRGKSLLMDLFFEAAPVKQRRRVHFHAFMQEVHATMAVAREAKTHDPVESVLDEIGADLSLICFDEMQVTDITDAMILGRLFEGFFNRNIALVVTSNRHPTELYKNGLQRERFVPFIDMICERLDVHQLDGPTDYRRERIRGADVYHTPLGPDTTAKMDAAWADIISGLSEGPLVLTVQGRDVEIPRFASGAARASFEALCAKPLGAADYLAITKASRSLFIDDIPILGPANANEAKRFVTLIDTLYEAGVTLVCSAAAEPNDLYVSGEGAFEFERTASRLIEMRSDGWPPPRDAA